MIATGTDEMAPETEFGTVSGPGTATTAITADLSFSFAHCNTEADLRALLLEHQLSIVSGPSALGLYRAAATEGTDIVALVSALDANPLVLFVQPVLQP